MLPQWSLPTGVMFNISEHCWSTATDLSEWMPIVNRRFRCMPSELQPCACSLFHSFPNGILWLSGHDSLLHPLFFLEYQGMGGCWLAHAWECQHLAYPGEQSKPTLFPFLLFGKGAEVLPRPKCLVFGCESTWSWS